MWLVEFSLAHRIPVACFSCHKINKISISCLNYSRKQEILLKNLLQNQQNLKARGIYSCTGIYFFKSAVFCSILHKQFYSSPQGVHLLYSDKLKFAGEQGGVSVPTKGTHLLYFVHGARGIGKSLFPSPRMGPIFSTVFPIFLFTRNIFVSVPTKGTHLLYDVCHSKGKRNICFRPHEGDPSSLLYCVC